MTNSLRNLTFSELHLRQGTSFPQFLPAGLYLANRLWKSGQLAVAVLVRPVNRTNSSSGRKTVVRFKFLLLMSGLASIVTLSGCSSIGSGISVSLASSATTIQQDQTLTITATVANDSTNAGVAWSLSGPGELTNISTTSVTYGAPTAVSANTTATVTATSVANRNASTSITINIEAVFEITTFSFPGGTLGVAYTGEVTAGGAATPFTWALTSGSLPPGLTLTPSTSTAFVTVSGTPTVVGSSTFTLQVTTAGGTSVSQTFSITISPPPPLIVVTGSLIDGTVGAAYSDTLQAANGVPPYTWSISTGSLPAGLSLSTAGVISGIPTTSGTSPFTVKVTDSSTPTPETATGNLSLTVNPSTVNNSKLSGNYAFLVTGFDASGHFTAAGSFVADGAGNISSGIMDSNDPANLQLEQSFNGTYIIGGNGLGSITFTGTGRMFALAMMADGNAKIIEFDSTTGAQDSGVLLKQDTAAFSTSQIVGSYAFGFLGADPQGNRHAFAGVFGADGSGNFTNGVLDSDGVSGITSDVAFTGTYTVSPTGRGTTALFISGQTVNCSFYVVSAGELFVIEIDDIAGQNRQIVSGSVLQQTGSLTLDGTSIFETTAVQSLTGSFTPQDQVGLLATVPTTGGAGTLTLTADENTGGTLTSPSGSGTYSVAANGRTTLTNSGLAASDPVLYLVSENQAFIIGTDPNVTFGFMETQSGTFTDSSLSGTYGGGSLPPSAASPVSEVDAATADGAGNLTFVTDSNTSGSIKNASSSGTYSVAANGRGTVTENATTTAIFYLASPAEFWSLSTDANAAVELFQQ